MTATVQSPSFYPQRTTASRRGQRKPIAPNQLRQDLTKRLRVLVYPTGRYFQDLLTIASDVSHSSGANVFVQCLTSHITKAPPRLRFTSILLLDAVCKNAPEPYARLFTPFVTKLFMNTYEQVHPKHRATMEELLLSWRYAAHSARELFGRDVQLTLEQRIWSSTSPSNIFVRSPQTHVLPVAYQHPTATQPSNVPTSLWHEPSSSPIYQSHSSQANFMNVNQGFPEKQFLLHPSDPIPQFSQSATYWNPSQIAGSTSGAPFPVTGTSLPQYSVWSQQGETNTNPFSTPDQVTATVDLVKIINLLKEAGIVSSSSSETKPTIPVSVGSAEKEVLGAPWSYRKAILSQKVDLTGNLLKTKPNISEFLFKRQPNQCKQCGLRFAEGPEGRKKMCDHVDSHIELKREATQGSKRGYSREWFLSASDWKNRRDIDVREKHTRGLSLSPLNKIEIDSRTDHVVVEPEETPETTTCSICMESIICEFVEDNEEWIWRDATRQNGKLYHASCHAEILSSKWHEQSEIRNSTRLSRTPGLVAGSGLAGRKRKAEDEPTFSDHQAKRLLLSQ